MSVCLTLSPPEFALLAGKPLRWKGHLQEGRKHWTISCSGCTSQGCSSSIAAWVSCPAPSSFQVSISCRQSLSHGVSFIIFGCHPGQFFEILDDCKWVLKHFWALKCLFCKASFVQSKTNFSTGVDLLLQVAQLSLTNPRVALHHD